MQAYAALELPVGARLVPGRQALVCYLSMYVQRSQAAAESSPLWRRPTLRAAAPTLVRLASQRGRRVWTLTLLSSS